MPVDAVSVRSRLRDAVYVVLCVSLNAVGAWGREPAVPVDFGSDVLPILAAHCFACHGPDSESRRGDLRLDMRDGVFEKRATGTVVVVPGDPDQSELFRRITRSDDRRMPPAKSGKQLAPEQVKQIRRWISEGAPWSRHWAFVPPRRPRLPPTDERGMSANAVDRFVTEKLSRQGLRLAPAADSPSLVRRVTLDLTGLPPTPDQVVRFVEDESPAAYENLVDRLLASPRYGERMAVGWLDVARYADTHGYLFDTERSMWRWRDWVIDAFNRNYPFDAFTIDQLAGDLLPEPTSAQRIATGFNRNHLINNEAGAIAAEYLVENVIDRVNTTATVWMGLSLACCQCHDHKYDPFTQREYYQFYAFFNTIDELGLDGLNANAKPLIKAPTALDREELAGLRQRTADAAARLELLAGEIAAAQVVWEKSFTQSSEAPTAGLAAHWPFDKTTADRVQPDRAVTYQASPESYSPGILGDAVALDGLGYLNGRDRFNFAARDSFSLSAWLRPNTKMGRLTIFSRMRQAKHLFRGYALQTVAGLPALFLVHKFPDNMIQVQGKRVMEPDQWHHLAVTYDGSGKAAGVKLFVNGELQTPGVMVDRLTESITTDREFWLGNGHPAAKWKGLLDDVRVYRRALTAEEIKRLPGLSIQSLLAIDLADRNAEQSRRVREFYLAEHAPAEWREPYQSLGNLEQELATRERDVPTVMVMREQKKTRETRLLVRGAYNKPGEIVRADTPAALTSLEGDLPRNRLGLARWLVDSKHPLTARTTVNRFWQMYFGRGLVRTPEDFGLQGAPPSHPDLLDWLATEFVGGGWDIKAIQKLIVTSATYRQSSAVTPERLQRDPDNRLLARGPRKRLSAEQIRDQALSVGGLLVQTIGGPSVRPYQPAGLWREVAFDFSGANLTAQVYEQDVGAKLYRRSVYTFWKRTAPPPTMLLFDAPDRERCVVRREQTSTPLQALALMNDPTFVEAARKLAERMMTEVRGGPQERTHWGFCLVTARDPSQRERSALVDLFERQRARFASNAGWCDEWLAVGASPPDESLDRSELAAYSVVASVMLNLDETITTH